MGPSPPPSLHQEPMYAGATGKWESADRDGAQTRIVTLPDIVDKPKRGLWTASCVSAITPLCPPYVCGCDFACFCCGTGTRTRRAKASIDFEVRVLRALHLENELPSIPYNHVSSPNALSNDHHTQSTGSVNRD